jgi:hypothetical protein
MKIPVFVLLTFLLLGLTSCIEIIDDITVNNDGSGTFKYAINLSSSKLKINSILSLDSLNGKKVPSILEIQRKLTEFKTKLSEKSGIKNVTIESNFTEYIFKLQCEFSSVAALQNALKETISEEIKDKNLTELQHNWLAWDGIKLIRSIPDITVKKTNDFKQEDIDLMKKGSYTSISRFERAVEKCENPAAAISKSKLAVKIRTTPYLLTQNANILENTIYLIPNKN